MMRRALYTVVALFCLLAVAASASSECAWVLWQEVPVGSGPRDARQAGELSHQGGRGSRRDHLDGPPLHRFERIPKRGADDLVDTARVRRCRREHDLVDVGVVDVAPE